ncbi:CvpA family protein [Alcaligenaceae bacterium 429]|uniref:CvpA family protein n=1 Tax=unclassified Paenalcaligenes TaxID=2685726 RepID=UPI00109313F4|nr:CvpA family protein [Alcaligenaceae bacterium 429]
MTSFDYLLLALLGLSSILGLIRGLLKELLSLIAYIAAFLVAIWWGPSLSVLLTDYLNNDLLRTAVSYAVLFIAALLTLGLLNMMLATLIDRSGLGSADHAFGALFGLLRGVVFALLLVILAGYTELPKEPWWQEARLSKACVNAVQQLKQLLPPSLASWLPY